MNPNPIGSGFQVPAWTSQADSALSRPGQPLGQRLFDDITEFYSWYVYSCLSGSSPLDTPQKGDSIPKILSVLKRIAEVSMNGGDFLSEKDESKVVDSLSNILQDLNSGKLRKQDLPEVLKQLTEDLTASNPKAKVVSQTTELEYRLCINPAAEQPADLTLKYQQTLSLIIEKINPDMREINASAIAQGLTQIIDHPHVIDDIHGAIHEAVRPWL